MRRLMIRSPKYGRLPAKHVPELALHNFKSGLSPIPASLDLSKGLRRWGELGNLDIGDCTCAALEHARMAKALVRVGLLGPVYEKGFRPPHTGYTEWLYYQCGLAQGYPGPKPDQGLYLADLLLWAYQHKIIEFYAEVDVNPANLGPNGESSSTRLHAGMFDFNGGLAGVSLNNNGEGQFMRGIPWSVSATDQPNMNLGHAIYGYGYTLVRDLWVTWGARQSSTYEWTKECLDEFWVVGTKEDADRAGYDYAAMQKVAESLPQYHGV